MFEHELEVLLKNIADIKKLIFFAGAGISVEAGYPLWGGATEMALQSSKSRGLLPSAALYAHDKWERGQYYEVFEILQKELTQPTFYQIAKDVFGGENEASEIHRLMVRTNCRGIITTNFDECLLSACVHERGSPPVSDIPEAMASDRFFVVKPHGSNLKPDSMVLSSSDWKKVEVRGELKDLLAQAVNQNQVFFLGYSFRDPDFNCLWDKILRERIFRAPAIYCCPQGSVEPSRLEEFRGRNIHVVEFPDDGSFKFLPHVLTAIVKHKEVPRPSIEIGPAEAVAQDLEKYVFQCLQFSPTQQGRLVLVAKAVALEFFASAKAERVTRGSLTNHVHAVLGQESELIQSATDAALRELSESQFVTLADGEVHIDGKQISVLAEKSRNFEEAGESWTDRVLREQASKMRTNVEVGDRAHIRAIFDKVLLESGRGVAELLLFNRAPGDESEQVDELVGKYCAEHGLLAKRQLYSKSVKRMLFDPSEAEEDLLFNRLQAYFIATAYVLNPTSERLLAEYARDHVVYFDSSIILPALAIGHPSNAVYKRLLHRTRALGMRLKIIREMVNEVWANIRTAVSAFREFSQTGMPLLDVLEGYVTLHGEGNGNVFIEGFLNQLRLDPSATPTAYMAAILGSGGNQTSEENVVTAISDSFDIQPDSLKSDELIAARLEPIINSIEHLRKQGNRYKNRMLCEHEARQFYLIHLRREQEPELQTKIWYVTTDRFVVELQRLERERYPLPIAYTPRNWFQYLDLVDFESRGSQHFSRLQPKMRFGVISGDLGIDAIRHILQEERDLLRKGVVSVKELAGAAVNEYHVRQSIAEYDKRAGGYIGDENIRREARERVKNEVQKAIGQFVAVRTQELRRLEDEKKEAKEEAERLKKRLAKEAYLVRTLRAQQKPRKKKKRRQ